MVQPLSTSYVFDPEAPRAPTREQWALMTAAERARVVDMLPVSLPLEAKPPEGDVHRKAKQRALSALDDFFRRAGRRIYLSSELIVDYPGERSFMPDLVAVLDVEPHDRAGWVVGAEGKGLDFVLDMLVSGEPSKDVGGNVERYSRLGIREYFIFNHAGLRLDGYRLSRAADPDAGRPGTYRRIVPQAGRFGSVVLGLDLGLDGDRLRFFAGNAPLQDVDERVARLGSMLDNVVAREEELWASLEEERRLREEERRLREEERRLREEADRQLAEARAEIARLTKG